MNALPRHIVPKIPEFNQDKYPVLPSELQNMGLRIYFTAPPLSESKEVVLSTFATIAIQKRVWAPVLLREFQQMVYNLTGLRQATDVIQTVLNLVQERQVVLYQLGTKGTGDIMRDLDILYVLPSLEFAERFTTSQYVLVSFTL